MISVLKIDNLILEEKGSWIYRTDEFKELPTVEIYYDVIWMSGGKWLEITLRTGYMEESYSCRDSINFEKLDLARFDLKEYVKINLLNQLLSLMNLSLN